MNKTNWLIDPMHSEIMFKVKHMMITNVSGTFEMFQANILSDAEDFSDMEVFFEAEVSSINTRNDHRDTHLRSNDFFDADNFPLLKFRSDGVRRISNETYELNGEFEIRGVIKQIPMQITYTGSGLDLWGQRKAGFEISGKINRSEFGLLWNATSDDGSLALAEEVQIVVSCQMIKQ